MLSSGLLFIERHSKILIALFSSTFGIFFFSLAHDPAQRSYRQCLPSRFKKDLIKVIASDGIETLLKNIGASERMTRTEIDTILSEAGSEDKKTVPANKMALLL